MAEKPKAADFSSTYSEVHKAALLSLSILFVVSLPGVTFGPTAPPWLFSASGLNWGFLGLVLAFTANWYAGKSIILWYQEALPYSLAVNSKTPVLTDQIDRSLETHQAIIGEIDATYEQVLAKLAGLKPDAIEQGTIAHKQRMLEAFRGDSSWKEQVDENARMMVRDRPSSRYRDPDEGDRLMLSLENEILSIVKSAANKAESMIVGRAANIVDSSYFGTDELLLNLTHLKSNLAIDLKRSVAELTQIRSLIVGQNRLTQARIWILELLPVVGLGVIANYHAIVKWWLPGWPTLVSILDGWSFTSGIV